MQINIQSDDNEIFYTKISCEQNTFLEVKTFIEKSIDELRAQLDNQKKCPMYLVATPTKIRGIRENDPVIDF